MVDTTLGVLLLPDVLIPLRGEGVIILGCDWNLRLVGVKLVVARGMDGTDWWESGAVGAPLQGLPEAEDERLILDIPAKIYQHNT